MRNRDDATSPPRAVTGVPKSRSASIALLLLGAIFIAYFPALRAGFVWDDDAHVTRPALRSVAGLGRIWSDPQATQQYYPLLHSAFWIEHRLWGDQPLGYHLTNLVLHGAAAFLFFLVLRRLAVPGALFAALVFAVHPVHVESVAWISEQKNTLSAVFYLGAAMAYLRFDGERRRGTYAMALGCFMLALLTKTVTATLPAALLVVFWWKRGGLQWKRDGAPLVPFLALALAGGLITAWLERALIGAEGATFDLSPAQRLILAGRAPWFYLGKLLWPQGLAFIYPRWVLEPHASLQWMPVLGAAALAVALWCVRQRSRAPLTVLLLFTGALFPVLGFFNVYPFLYSFVADHFQYLASLGVIALVAAAATRVFARSAGLGRVLAIGAVVALGVTTWQQSRTYHDRVTLFRATLSRNRDAWMAHNNLGKELLGEKTRLPEAIRHFERAIALRPEYPEAQNNLGLALTQSGRPRDAIPHLEASLRLKPDAHQTHNNLGIALASSGRAEEAVHAFARAAELNPGLPNIHENWAKALLLVGRRPEAEERFAIAARLRAAADRR
ncbi:MAG TPA: tetratricopeptide repeat protein [Opitutaceae bacterium]|nr:tetratricopeptide repeat protein [Opitutaceae bacterium]